MFDLVEGQTARIYTQYTSTQLVKYLVLDTTPLTLE